MDGDGTVGIDDFHRFLSGFQLGTPGPGPSSSDVVDPLLPFQEDQCWDDRVGLPRPLRSAESSSDGCSLTQEQLARVDLSLFGIVEFLLDGDVNNPTDHVVRTRSDGLLGCPSAAFGSFKKATIDNSDRCGINVASAICGAERTGLPCLESRIDDEAPAVCSSKNLIACVADTDCPTGPSCFQGDGGGVCNSTSSVACEVKDDCETALGVLDDPSDPGNEWKCHAMNCGDPFAGRACESHHSCGALCGYRKYQCDDQLRDCLFATCHTLEGQERELCQDLCFVFAAAHADDKNPPLQNDDGTWLATDVQLQGARCRCCSNLVEELKTNNAKDAEYATTLCGDGVCNPATESCLLRSRPQDCGSCTGGRPVHLGCGLSRALLLPGPVRQAARPGRLRAGLPVPERQPRDPGILRGRVRGRLLRRHRDLQRQRPAALRLQPGLRQVRCRRLLPAQQRLPE